MKKIILFYLLMVSAGCGIFKQVHKEKETLKTEVNQEVKKDSSGVTINKSVITVKEKVDTILTVPEKVVRQQTILNMDSLIKGITAVKNNLVDVNLILNPVTHVLSAVATLKAQVIPLQIDKQTTIQNNIVRASTQSQDYKTKDKLAASHSILDKKPINIGRWLFVLFVCILIPGVIYWFVKEKLKLF